MRYADCVKRGLTIGSGVVEAANKTQVTERLKWSGIRWGLEGGQEVLTFRSLVKSDRFGKGPYLIRKISEGPISLPASVLYRPAFA